ncbi:nacrein-like protein F [Saccostrea cucullata]|uniref:nacrein-like protein F n=1 Tax=Saccostrea cuccullata TaxID=36930 RepID=UPI002ED41AB8
MARYLLLFVFLKVLLPDVVYSTQCFEPDCNKAKFNYNPFSCLAPSSWAAITPCWSTCNGQRQSPVNIIRNQAVFQSNLQSFSFNIGVQDRFMVSTHIKGFKTSYKVEEDVILSKVNQFGLNGKSFKLDSFHFHAGKFRSSKGSEHSFDNEFQPLELHLVFYNTEYPDVKTAAGNADGLLVIGVMVQVYPGFSLTPFPGCENDYKRTLSNLMGETLSSTEYPDSSSSEETDSFIRLKNLLPSNRGSYYTYQGSLTTPPCSEAVTWVLMKCPIIVSKSALKAFQQLEISSTGERLGVYGNHRPIQRDQQNTPFTVLKNF